jgi:tetratricopeptide (TPR) repeat protein
MNKCIDSKYERLLYAYELGLLSEDELQEFEIHLLDCEHCFNKVAEFKEAATLIRHDPLVNETIAQLADDSQTRVSRDIEQKKAGRSFFSPAFKRIAIASAILLIVFLIRPWNLQFKPTHEAIAAQNRIIVLYFKNLPASDDSNHLGEIATNLLITDLAESQQLQVVSMRRLQDIATTLGSPNYRVLDDNTSSRIAEKADANLIISGTILQSEPNIILTAELFDSKNGISLASYKLSGARNESIFSVIDKLTIEVKKTLNLSLESEIDPDPDVEKITTNSREAYEYYLEGLDFYNKYYYPEASKAFKKAVSIDSAFAAAYYYLSITDDAGLIDNAVKHADNTSTIQRYLILSRAAILRGDVEQAKNEMKYVLERYPQEKEAHYWLGSYSQTYEHNPEEAIFHLRNAIELDSSYKNAYNKIAYAYMALGACEKASWAIDKYVSLAPDEANPYDSRGEIYSLCGDLDEAINSYKKALEIKPTFTNSLIKLGIMYVFRGDYTKADSCFSGEFAPSCCIDDLSRELYYSTIPVNQGKLEQGIGILRKGIDKIGEDSKNPALFKYYGIKAILHWEKNQYDSAYSDLKKASDLAIQLNPADQVNFQPQIIRLLCESGNVAEAEKLSANLRMALDTLEYGNIIESYNTANIEMARGDYSRAAELLEVVADASEGLAPDIVTTTLLANAYMKSGAPDKAVNILEKQLPKYTELRAYLGNYSVKLHYYLGLAYQELKFYDSAREQYETFLTAWENADPDLPALSDARSHLARLKVLP